MGTSTSSGSLADQHGNPMTGSRDAVDLYDLTLDRLLRYDVAVLDLAGRLGEEAADVPMAQVMLAYLTLMSTDAADVAGARECVSALRALPMNARESAHADAADAWCDGDWTGVSTRLDEIVMHHPTDLLALMIGHQLDFFLGDNLNLRDRVCRSLPSLDAAHPHHGFVLGMQAFGLEEAGSYAQAEQAGLGALDANPDDVWAVHAVVHTLEMQGRVDEGIRFMVDRRADWGSGNMFTVHNWWHLGLYCLEAGRHELALAIYDREIHHAESDGVPIEMLDASALLWRLRLDGVDTGDRFAALADAWAAKLDGAPWYAFNDLHATMAFVGADRLAEARAVVERLAAYLEAAGGTNGMMTAEVGLPASRAVVAHGEGRFADVVADLAPIRRRLQRFGGSHAQRDVLQRTLLDAAIRVGDLDRARALIDERLTLRPTNVYGWDQRARLHAAMGSSEGATAAAATAADHRQRFAAVARDVTV
jgi:tetratricopeptide (TPR) repeat protein